MKYTLLLYISFVFCKTVSFLTSLTEQSQFHSYHIISYGSNSIQNFFLNSLACFTTQCQLLILLRQLLHTSWYLIPNIKYLIQSVNHKII